MDKWRDPSPASKVKVRLKAASSLDWAAGADGPALKKRRNNTKVCSHRHYQLFYTFTLKLPGKGDQPPGPQPRWATKLSPQDIVLVFWEKYFVPSFLAVSTGGYPLAFCSMYI